MEVLDSSVYLKIFITQAIGSLIPPNSMHYQINEPVYPSNGRCTLSAMSRVTSIHMEERKKARIYWSTRFPPGDGLVQGSESSEFPNLKMNFRIVQISKGHFLTVPNININMDSGVEWSSAGVGERASPTSCANIGVAIRSLFSASD